MYPRGNSRSATATPNGSPKRRLPQIPGQGLPASAPTAASSRMGGGRLRGGLDGGASMGGMTYHASYDGGLNNGAQMHPRGQSLHPSTRSRSMGHYGGYRYFFFITNVFKKYGYPLFSKLLGLFLRKFFSSSRDYIHFV